MLTTCTSELPSIIGGLTESCRRFFHPNCIDDMLQEFLPQFNGTSHSYILMPLYYMVAFLPLSHPQSYLPALFVLWRSINSYMYDSRMIPFLSKLCIMHVDPTVSDPAKLSEIPDDARGEKQDMPWDKSSVHTPSPWPGLWSDIGIFTEDQWQMLMCKLLLTMGKYKFVHYFIPEKLIRYRNLSG